MLTPREQLPTNASLIAGVIWLIYSSEKLTNSYWWFERLRYDICCQSFCFIIRTIFDIDLSPIRCHSFLINGEKKVYSIIYSLLPTPRSSSSRPPWKPHQASEGSTLRIPRIPSTSQLKQTNNKFPCLPYERTLVQCINNYGVQGAYQVPECLQMSKFLTDCLSINKYFGLMKRWNPEHFAENEYSRERVNLSDIGFWFSYTNHHTH